MTKKIASDASSRDTTLFVYVPYFYFVFFQVILQENLINLMLIKMNNNLLYIKVIEIINIEHISTKMVINKN